MALFSFVSKVMFKSARIFTLFAKPCGRRQYVYFYFFIHFRYSLCGSKVWRVECINFPQSDGLSFPVRSFSATYLPHTKYQARSRSESKIINMARFGLFISKFHIFYQVSASCLLLLSLIKNISITYYCFRFHTQFLLKRSAHLPKTLQKYNREG